jgi:AcrR family transcriptional regulator
MNRLVCIVKDMSSIKLQGSARERLLAAATELFYAEGVHTVGIDRVIERAGVAKASLYSTFGSKDELVRAYLEGRVELRRKRVAERLERGSDPRERILTMFDGLAESAAQPGYRGCAFVKASSEGPRGETKVDQVTADSRAWLRELFVDLAQQVGSSEPERTGQQLFVLYDGAMIGAAMDHDPAAVGLARGMAEMVIDAAHSSRKR